MSRRATVSAARPYTHLDTSSCHPGSVGLSRTDVSKREVVLDAQHQLHRCKSEADYAAWAVQWGDAFVIDALTRKPF